jgi:frataxin-like iron-binding protein CyaY
LANESKFQDEAEKLISKVKIIMEDMKTLNNEFLITHEDSTLTVDTGEKGQFIFSIDIENEKFRFSSPVSGVFQYEYDEESGEWLSSVDRHDVRGLLTRDFIKHWIGVPKW